MKISWSVKTVAGSSCLKISKIITLTSNPSWKFTVGVTRVTRVKTKEKEIKMRFFPQRMSFSHSPASCICLVGAFPDQEVRQYTRLEVKFFVGTWSPTSKRFSVESSSHYKAFSPICNRKGFVGKPRSLFRRLIDINGPDSNRKTKQNTMASYKNVLNYKVALHILSSLQLTKLPWAGFCRIPFGETKARVLISSLWIRSILVVRVKLSGILAQFRK